MYTLVYVICLLAKNLSKIFQLTLFIKRFNRTLKRPYWLIGIAKIDFQYIKICGNFIRNKDDRFCSMQQQPRESISY